MMHRTQRVESVGQVFTSSQQTVSDKLLLHSPHQTCAGQPRKLAAPTGPCPSTTPTTPTCIVPPQLQDTHNPHCQVSSSYISPSHATKDT